MNAYYHKLFELISLSPNVIKVFDALDKTNISDYYVGAGAVLQTVWNHLMGSKLDYGIDDIDVIFYNATDLSKESEAILEKRIKDDLGQFPFKLDVKNQARVHLWYKDKFGYDIEPYRSLEAAINTWPTTGSSVGIRRSKDGWYIYAPFGLRDMMNLVIRANNRQITEEIYNRKSVKWLTKWPHLSLVEWDNKEVAITRPEVVMIKGGSVITE